MHGLLVGGGERGGAVNVQVAVLYSLLLVTFMTVLQAGLFFYGRDLALSAARSGVDLGRTYGTVDAAAAQTHTESVLVSNAHGVLSNATATASANDATMTVTVDAEVVTLVPGLTMHVSTSSTGAIEQLTR
jgi:Flp pilus assembly protein TadG